MEENKKLYSNREITIATFFGGPMAAGYLMKKNFQVMGDSDMAGKSLLIGIISSIIIFGVLYSLPEPVMDKIPQPLIPAIYTAIISLIVNKLQGPFIKEHKENGGLYHSGWKAAGVGSISMLILIVGIVIVAFLTGDIAPKTDFDSVRYKREAAQFTENESKAIEIYKLVGTADPDFLKGELERSQGLWRSNKDIIIKLNSFKDIPKDQNLLNQDLLRYCDLRLQLGQLLIQSTIENSEKYIPEITRIGLEINKLMKDISTKNNEP